MIDVKSIESILRNEYPELENVSEGVFRAIDCFNSKQYAIRYFNLNDDLISVASNIKGYQEHLLADMYFKSDGPTDLRWNHYLYFINSQTEEQRTEFTNSKLKVESDREYARKQVIRESDFSTYLIKKNISASTSAIPIDLATTWTTTLNQHGLGYVLDDGISVPKVVQKIAEGKIEHSVQTITPIALLESERAATRHFVSDLTIDSFRPHPQMKHYLFGHVNLIIGCNGVGKTSLLEAIEFAYCGRNNRSSEQANSSASITLGLTGSPETLRSTLNSERLKARNSNWYAKTDIKKLTIHDSFGKFNFLNTDAAVNLSVTGSSDQLSSDVRRLLLGPAAEGLADRIKRVLDQLQSEEKRTNSELLHTNFQIEATKKLISELSNIPKHSDSIFIQLLERLKLVKWRLLPESKSELNQLQSALVNAASAAEILKGSSTKLQSLLKGLKNGHLLEHLKDIKNDAERMASIVKNANENIKITRTHIDIKHQRSILIDALLPYAQSSFEMLVKDIGGSVTLTQSLSQKLINTDRIDHDLIADLRNDALKEVVIVLNRKIQEIQGEIAKAKLLLQEMESKQNVLSVLHERLIATATEFLKQNVNPDHCPICHSDFEQGVLIQRMSIEMEGQASETLRNQQDNIYSLEHSLQHQLAILSSISILDFYVSESDTPITVGEVLEKIRLDTSLLETELNTLHHLQSRLDRLFTDGLSANQLSIYLLEANLLNLPSIEELETLRNDCKSQIDKLNEAIINDQEKIRLTSNECEDLTRRQLFEITRDPQLLLDKVTGQIVDLERSTETLSSLLNHIEIDDESVIEGILINLTASQSALTNLITAEAEETSSSNILKEQNKKLKDLNGNYQQLSKKSASLNSAGNALKNLERQYSDGEISNQILMENADEIANTFSKIHMPNEFDLRTENGSLSIIRRSSGLKIELEQMSTGQRSAFALSLFLAMNARLKSAPPVLLFDDPVAHIDDINILSFLDHLRQLAINNSRQIFFATADNKLAGLFRHKFRFLGEGFKEILLTRTD